MNRRLESGGWISSAASSADIRTAGDAVCFLLIGACVVAIGFLVVAPWIFRDAVMSIVASVFGGPL